MQKAFGKYEVDSIHVKRVDRDRPGGHWCSPSASEWKRKDRRKLRQEQRRITAEAVLEWECYTPRLCYDPYNRDLYPEGWFLYEKNDWKAGICYRNSTAAHEFCLRYEETGEDDWDDYREEYGNQVEDYCDPYEFDWDCGYSYEEYYIGSHYSWTRESMEIEVEYILNLYTIHQISHDEAKKRIVDLL